MASEHPDAGLIPERGTQAWREAMQWVVFAPAELDPVLATLNVHRLFSPPAERIASVGQRAHELFEARARLLSDVLDGRPHLLGDDFTVADICVGHSIVWARMHDLLRDFPALQAYLDRLQSARPSWRSTAQKWRQCRIRSRNRPNAHNPQGVDSPASLLYGYVGKCTCSRHSPPPGEHRRGEGNASHDQESQDALLTLSVLAPLGCGADGEDDLDGDDADPAGKGDVPVSDDQLINTNNNTLELLFGWDYAHDAATANRCVKTQEDTAQGRDVKVGERQGTFDLQFVSERAELASELGLDLAMQATYSGVGVNSK